MLRRLRRLPELALVVEFRLVAPHPQDDVERLARHLAIDAGHAVDLEHRPVGRQPRRGDAEIQPALREVIQHRHAGGEFRRVVVGQQEAARADAQALGLQQRLGDEQVGRGMRFPRRGVVLADPRLGVAELVEPAQRLEVPVVARLQASLRRMGGHGEIAEFHGGSS